MVDDAELVERGPWARLMAASVRPGGPATSAPATVSGADVGSLGKVLMRAWLLVLLADGPCHGYELVTALNANGVASPDGGYVYRNLRLMESSGLLASCWDASDRGGPRRRVYRLTGSGRAALDDCVAGIAALEENLRDLQICYRRVGGDDARAAAGQRRLVRDRLA